MPGSYRLLLIGNSFTARNNLPGLITQLASKPIDYRLISVGGAPLRRHWNGGQALAAIKAGDLKFESINTSDLNIRFYGNTAVATWLSISKGTNKSMPVAGQSRVTSVFVKSKGQWRSVAAQVTRVAGQ